MPFTNSDIVGTFAPTIQSPATGSTYLWTDTIDWAGILPTPIDPANVSGTITFTRPDGFNAAASFVAGGNSASLPFPRTSGNPPLHQKGQWIIRVDLTIAGAVDPGNYTRTFTIGNYCPEEIVPAFNWTINCLLSPIVSVMDASPYPAGSSITSRVVTLQSPAGTGGSNYTNTSNGATANSGSDTVYKGKWGVTLATTATTTDTSVTDLTIFTTYNVTQRYNNAAVGSAMQDVQCNTLCEYNCCVRGAWDRWINAGCPNSADSELFNIWHRASSLLTAASRELNDCGSTDKYQAYIDELEKITNCDSTCGCASPVSSDQIVPIGDAGAITEIIATDPVVATLINGVLSIGLNVFGTTVINNARLYNHTSPNSTVIIGPFSTDNTTTPATITVPFEVASGVRARDSIEFLINVTSIPNASGSVPTLAVADAVIKGDATYFQAPTLTAQGASGANIAKIVVSAFDAGSLPITWKPTVEFVDFSPQNGITNQYVNNGYSATDVPLKFAARVVDRKTAGPSFDISFRDEGASAGDPGFWYNLGGWMSECTLRVRIAL